MRVIPRGNYSYPRVGYELDIPAGLPGPWGFTAGPEFIATGSDQALYGLEKGKAFRTWTFRGYPLVIDRDTTFLGVCFDQEEPHTEIFSVVAAPGSLVLPVVRFVNCPLQNVSVPDGAIINGGNLSQGFWTPTGNPEREFLFTLCACEKCCVVRPVIQEIKDEGNVQAFLATDGLWPHHELKEYYRARRKDSEFMAVCQERILTENDEAVAWLDPRQAEALEAKRSGKA